MWCCLLRYTRRILTLNSFDKILKCDPSNGRYWAVLSCSSFHCTVQGGSTFWVCGLNPTVWPFKRDPRYGALRKCLFFLFLALCEYVKEGCNHELHMLLSGNFAVEICKVKIHNNCYGKRIAYCSDSYVDFHYQATNGTTTLVWVVRFSLNVLWCLFVRFPSIWCLFKHCC